MGQSMRVYACLLCLVAGGCGGAALLDGTVGARERERVRALHPGEPLCGGPGIDIYLAGGFVLGVVPVAWGLRRLGAAGWVAGTGGAADAEPVAAADGSAQSGGPAAELGRSALDPARTGRAVTEPGRPPA